MPHYHFDVHTSVEARDEEGIDFADLAEAKAFAMKNAHFMAVEEMRRDRRFSPNHSIKITGGDGVVLHSVRYGDCVDVRL